MYTTYLLNIIIRLKYQQLCNENKLYFLYLFVDHMSSIKLGNLKLFKNDLLNQIGYERRLFF